MSLPAVPAEKISPQIAKKFCNSLSLINPLLYLRFQQQYENYKLVHRFNPKPFEQFVTDLVFEQSIESLIIYFLEEGIVEQSGSQFSCECISLFNQQKAMRAFSLATQRIEEMLRDPLCSFDIFHQYSILAFYNASLHIDALLAQSLRVAAYLRVGDAADQPVADAAALPFSAPILQMYPF